LQWVAPVLAVALFASWELAAGREAIPTLFFPAPSTILQELGEVTRSGELPMHLGFTLSRMFLGLAWGASTGLILGMILGYSAKARAVIDPFIAAIHPVPKMSLLPLIMLIFGIGLFSKTLVVAIATFFPMTINTMAGVRDLDRNYYDVARLHGASSRRLFWRVVLPGALPMILTGGRLAMNRALGATIGLELITAHNGLGSMLFFAWQTLRTEELYATIFVIAAFGYCVRTIVNTATTRLVPWQEEPE
jgi:NitT/TauT family transport system permease protein